MDTRARHLFIGLFVVGMVACILVFALWLGKSSSSRDFSYYQVLFDEPVQGLSVGSRVQYSGIAAGEVVKLSLWPEDPRRAIARIRVDRTIPIRVDTKAELVITGITGSAVVQLTDGGPDIALMERNEDEEPVIMAPRSAMASLMSAGENTMTNVNETLLRTQSLMSQENLAMVTRILENMEQGSQLVAEQRTDLKELVVSMQQASQEAVAVLRQANATVRDAGLLLNGDGKEAVASARDAMKSLQRTLERVDSVFARNQQSLDRGLSDVGPVLQEFKTTLSTINTVLARLERDPAAYLLGGEKLEETTP